MNNPKPGEWAAEKLSRGFIADYKPFNMVDGEGIRCSLYVSGCLFACEGCYNKAAQSFSYGKPYTKELEETIVKDISHQSVQGLTLVGGEPFLNTNILIPLVRRFRREFGNTKDIWVWTGYTLEELKVDTPDKLELLSMIDVLVDGRFEIDKKDLSLRFRGSSNQRIIDIQKTYSSGTMVLWKDGDY